MGVEHGERMRTEINHNLTVYFKRFRNETKLSREQVLQRAAKYLPVIERTAPAYAEEMKGVARGSNSDLLDIVALNVRYELMYSQYSKLGIPAVQSTDGCTSFAIAPEMSENEHVLMAQNWDWIPEVDGLFLRTVNGDEPGVICFTEAGVVGGKIGINSEGLGLMINGLVSNKDDWSRLEKPFHVQCWEILRSKSLEDAVRIISEGHRSCSANFLIGQQKSPGKGLIVDMESAPDAVTRLFPENGVIAHTNHFCNPASVGISQVIDEEWRSTLTRYDRVSKMLNDHVTGKVKLSMEKAKTMLRDHHGRPDSLCRHPNLALAEDDRYKSVVSVVMDLEERKLWATDGSPCENDYRLIGF
jgi:isopenicillin-N N-acyltransferase-like protein